MSRLPLCIISALVVLGITSTGFAQAKKPATLEIGVGIKGGMNGSWATEVPEQSRIRSGNQEYVVDPEYYPLFGLGGDFGLSVDIRAWGLIALETGFKVSFDNGKGWNDKKQAGSDTVITRINQEQSTLSYRIPLMLKLSGTSGLVRPYLSLGAEFVIQSENNIEYTEEKRAGQLAPGELERLQQRNQIDPSSYVGLGGALGLEIDLGFLRIPIELRGLYNVNYGESFDERVKVEGDNPNAWVFRYNGMYQGHFGFSIGILYNHTLF